MSQQSNNNNNNNNNNNLNNEQMIPSTMSTNDRLFRSVLAGPSSLSTTTTSSFHSFESSNDSLFNKTITNNALSGKSFQQQPLKFQGFDNNIEEKMNIIVVSDNDNNNDEFESNCAVPDIPSYVEKYTSFSTGCFPHEILQQLVQSFSDVAATATALKIIYEVCVDEYRIEGTIAELHVAANFRINIFKKKQSTDYLVEFQRMSGDIIVFNSFYRLIKSKVASSLLNLQNGEEVLNSNPTFNNSFSVLPMPSFFSFPSDCNSNIVPSPPPQVEANKEQEIAPISLVSQESLAPLMEMVKSRYVDVCCEGLKAIAGLSSSEKFSDVLSEQLPCFLTLLSNQIQSHCNNNNNNNNSDNNENSGFQMIDADVIRYLCFTLMNLSKKSEISLKMKQAIENAKQESWINELSSHLQSSKQTSHKMTATFLNQLAVNIKIC